MSFPNLHPSIKLQETESLCWIGIERMGSVMVLNLARSVFPGEVRMFDRSKARADELIGKSGTNLRACESIFEAVQGCRIVFILVSDDEAILDVVGSICACSIDKSRVVCDMTTVHPKTTQKAADMLEHAGQQLVAAPIFGGPAIATNSKVVLIYAGRVQAVQHVKPFFAALCRETLYVGEKSSSASLLKITGNALQLSMLEAVAEGLTFAEVSGLGIDHYIRLLSILFPESPMEVAVKRMHNGAYYPKNGERTGCMAKDCLHAIELAKSCEPPYRFPLLKHVYQNLVKVMHDSRLRGRNDVTSIYGIEREYAGLPLENEAACECTKKHLQGQKGQRGGKNGWHDAPLN